MRTFLLFLIFFFGFFAQGAINKKQSIMQVGEKPNLCDSLISTPISSTWDIKEKYRYSNLCFSVINFNLFFIPKEN